MPLNQYYTSGTLTYTGGNTVPFGSGGLLDTLRSVLLGTVVADEVLYSQAGVTTSFTGNALANVPCGLGRLVITYTVSSTDYTASDDGAGNIYDDASGFLTSGTVDYDTGDVDLVFGTAPDNPSDITADYIYGDPGQDWEELLYQDTENKDETDAGFSGDCKEWIIRNTGKTGQENVIIGLREWWYAAGNGGGLNLNVYTAWPVTPPTDWNYNELSNGLADYNVTWKTWQKHPTLPLPYRGTIGYFLYSNRQRIVLVVKISGQYESIYLGFGRRFGTPSEYPHPLVAKAGHHHSDASFNAYSYTAGAWRLFAAGHYPSDDDGYPLLIVKPDDSYESGNDSAGLTLIPYDNYGTSDGIMRPTPIHTRSMVTPVYVGHETTEAVWMDLDGVTHVASSGVSAEDTFYMDQKLHVVFPNVNKTANYDFMAVAQRDYTTTTTSTTSTTSSTSTTTAP